MRKALTRLMPVGSFARNVGVLTSGTVFAQGLSVLALPLLTRLYTPEDFALLAVYTAVLAIVTVVSSLRYNIAIPLPENDSEAMALLGVSLLASTGITLLIALPVVLAPVGTASVLGQPELVPYLWMVPLGVFLASAYNALQYWASRKKRFGLVTRTRVTRAVGGIGTQSVVGAVAPSPFGLIFGHMIYSGLGVLGLILNLWRSDRHILRDISFKEIINAGRKNLHFATKSTPAAFFDAGYQWLPILIIASVAGDATIGVIFIVLRIMSAPIQIVGASISQVYLSSASDWLRNGVLATFTHKLMLFGIVASFAFSMLLAAFLMFFSSKLFGQAYSTVGTLALWMVPWVTLQMTCSPVSGIFFVTSRQSAWLALQVVGFLIIVAGTGAGAFLYPNYIISIFIFCNSAFYLIVTLSILYTLNITKE